MKLYVATGFERADKASEVMEALRSLGHTITFDWTVYRPMVLDGWKPDPEQLEGIASEEVEAVKDADALIVLLPGGKGTHVELGVALAMRKPVCIFGDEARSVPFYLHSSVVFRGSPREAGQLAQIATLKIREQLRLVRL